MSHGVCTGLNRPFSALQSHSGLVEEAGRARIDPLARFGGSCRIARWSRGRVTSPPGNLGALVVTLVVTR